MEKGVMTAEDILLEEYENRNDELVLNMVKELFLLHGSLVLPILEDSGIVSNTLFYRDVDGNDWVYYDNKIGNRFKVSV